MIEVNAPPLVGENLLMLGGPAAVTVKVGPIACPPGVITCTGPGDAVGGTVAVIWVALFTTKLVALVRLKRTPVAPVKSVPVIVTDDPNAPNSGATMEMVGGGSTMKLEDEVPVPMVFVTATGPVAASAGTVKKIRVSLEVLELAGTLPSVTPVAPVKFVPVTVTVLPIPPAKGEKPLTVGTPALTTMNGEAVEADPLGPETLICPVSALGGTAVLIWVAETTVNGAVATKKPTEAIAPRLVPLIVTEVPGGPIAGLKEVMVGGTAMVSEVLETVVPPGVTTVRGPVVAPRGTDARSMVSVPPSWTVPGTPLNDTAVAPVKLAPEMVTVMNVEAEVGAKPVITGAWTTVTLNDVAEVAWPPGA